MDEKLSVTQQARLSELDANYLLPSNTEVKNKKSYTSTVPIHLLCICRNNFAYKYFKTNNCATTAVRSMLPDVRPCVFLCVIVIRKLYQQIRVVGMSHFIYINAHVRRNGRWIQT